LFLIQIGPTLASFHYQPHHSLATASTFTDQNSDCNLLTKAAASSSSSSTSSGLLLTSTKQPLVTGITGCLSTSPSLSPSSNSSTSSISSNSSSLSSPSTTATTSSSLSSSTNSNNFTTLYSNPFSYAYFNTTGSPLSSSTTSSSNNKSFQTNHNDNNNNNNNKNKTMINNNNFIPNTKLDLTSFVSTNPQSNSTVQQSNLNVIIFLNFLLRNSLNFDLNFFFCNKNKKAQTGYYTTGYPLTAFTNQTVTPSTNNDYRQIYFPNNDLTSIGLSATTATTTTRQRDYSLMLTGQKPSLLHQQYNPTLSNGLKRKRHFKKPVELRKVLPKNSLMLLHEYRPNVEYRFVCQSGPIHKPTFCMCVDIEEHKFEGTGGTKKDARMMAADKALEFLNQHPEYIQKVAKKSPEHETESETTTTTDKSNSDNDEQTIDVKRAKVDQNETTLTDNYEQILTKTHESLSSILEE
jgi:hypothetical protein